MTALRNAAADELTAQHGTGHWSSQVTENGVLRGVLASRVLVAREGDVLLGTLTLATKKPWAIDLAYFTPARHALYLLNMAVAPSFQRRGVGRELLLAAEEVARAAGVEVIRLDAYDAPAGAGGFCARCGYHERGRVSYRGVPLVYFERMV